MSNARLGQRAVSVAFFAISAVTMPPVRAADSSIAGQYLHIFTWVSDYTDNSSTPHLCSAPGTQLTVQLDDGAGNLTVTIEKIPNPPPLPPKACTGGMVAPGNVYTVAKKNITSTSYTSESIVMGVLTVPFKFHISNRSVTAGSTIGGYIGYRMGVENWFTITPVVAGGLALISTQAAQASSSGTPAASPSTQTSSGFSVAIGLIGSASNSGSGAQFGILAGLDWLGRSANYQYEGKPWIAFEIGYNFAQ